MKFFNLHALEWNARDICNGVKLNLSVSAVARFDFSCLGSDYHQETIDNLRTAIKRVKKFCAVSELWPKLACRALL